MTDDELLDRAVGDDNLLRSILLEDTWTDWAYAKDLGKYLIRVDATLLCGHLLVARSCRHLREFAEAAKERHECRVIVDRGDLGSEIWLVAILQNETALLEG